MVILLGADKKQAAILRLYCEGLLRAPLLDQEITRSTGDVTEFRNGSSLEIATNDARLVRGRSAIAVLGSECCHWRTDEHAASSDEEVVGAAEPSMAMCPDGGLLMLGSSVHRKVGYMYRQYKKLHGNNDTDDICWFAPSNVMNPVLPAHVIDKALAENASKARAEFRNIWREDLSDFIPLDVLDACDTGSTSPRSVGEVALIWDTISHYSPVLIAPLVSDFIALARPDFLLSDAIAEGSSQASRPSAARPYISCRTITAIFILLK